MPTYYIKGSTAKVSLTDKHFSKIVGSLGNKLYDIVIQ